MAARGAGFTTFFATFGLFFRKAPRLLLLALGCAAGVTFIAWGIITGLIRPLSEATGIPDFDLIGYAWTIPMLAAHAIFLVIASRTYARALAPDLVTPWPPGRWLPAILAVTIIMSAGLAAGLAVVPLPSAVGVIVALSALFAWTPILPGLALGEVQSIGRFVWTAVAVSLPWLLIVEVLGWPAQVCTGECWGMLEGGLVMLPIFALHTFLASTTAALVSTSVWVAIRQDGAADQ